MGNLISPWRKKSSVTEDLEELDKNIASIEKLKEGNLDRQKSLVGSLIFYSVLIYITGAAVFYVYYTPVEWTHKIVYSLPLLIFPILVYILKRLLHWYFVKRINRYEKKLDILKEKKKEILENVMEKETFKVAKEILEKFDPEKLHGVQGPQTPIKPDSNRLNESNVQEIPKGVNTPNMKNLKSPIASTTPFMKQMTPPQTPQQASCVNTPAAGAMSVPRAGLVSHTPLPMPRPVPPRHRSLIDRVVDYLIQDGPENRYALICTQCLSHNGMALREEFEYMGFRCCYCYTVNPAKRQRPTAPKLATALSSAGDTPVKPPPQTTSSDSESVPNGGNELETSCVEPVDEDSASGVRLRRQLNPTSATEGNTQSNTEQDEKQKDK